MINWSRYYKVEQKLLGNRDSWFTTKCGSRSCKVAQVLQRGATLLKRAANIAKWGSYYKVGQYIEQRYIKELVWNLLSSPISLILLLGTKANGGICLHIGPKWFEARVVYYVEMAFSRDRPFQKDTYFCYGLHNIRCIRLHRALNP